jgi:hypothetical protein
VHQLPRDRQEGEHVTFFWFDSVLLAGVVFLSACWAIIIWTVLPPRGKRGSNG